VRIVVLLPTVDAGKARLELAGVAVGEIGPVAPEVLEGSLAPSVARTAHVIEPGSTVATRA
jgi:hypothetical protein